MAHAPSDEFTNTPTCGGTISEERRDEADGIQSDYYHLSIDDLTKLLTNDLKKSNVLEYNIIKWLRDEKKAGRDGTAVIPPGVLRDATTEQEKMTEEGSPADREPELKQEKETVEGDGDEEVCISFVLFYPCTSLLLFFCFWFVF